MASIQKKLHVKYFQKCLQCLPGPYSSLDTNRLTVAYFCTSALDLLGALDAVEAAPIVEWIYAQQVVPPADGGAGLPAERRGGFRGGGYNGAPFAAGGAPSAHALDTAHIAMTYTALAVLTMLGDDLGRVRRAETLAFVRSLQGADGSFRAYAGGEADMRFVYCAAAICTLLGDGVSGGGGEWSGLDREAATAYVLSAVSYDAGVGLGPGQEGHGGSVYTGIAALALLGTLDRLPTPRRLVDWCVARQVGGFQGRPNKDEDTCYSFWIGATLALLGEAAAPEAAASAAAAAAAAPPPPRPPALAAGAARLSDPAALAAFSLRCECAPYGGFAKCVGNHPDVLHSYFALCGLAIVGAPGLRPLDCRLGMTKRAAAAAGLRAAEPEAVECE